MSHDSVIESDLVLLHARWVIPVEPPGVVFDHHSLVVHHGKIREILPTAVATQRYPTAVSQIFPTHVLIPGLVNAHTHAAMTLLRGLADDLPLMTWLNEHIWPAEARWVSPEFVRDGTLLAAAEMLLGGVTCFNDMYFFPVDAANAAVAAGIRACIGLIVLDFPTAWAQSAAEYLSQAQLIHRQLADFPLIRTALAPHAPYTVSDPPLAEVRALAERLDLPIHIHVHETATEVAQSLVKYGERPLARLERLGLLSSRLIAVHMTQLTEEEVALCARRNIHVAHCPESNLKLASGFCPVERLNSAGVNVALGTDGAASNNDLDLLGEMRTAALLAKAVANDAAKLPAPAAIHLATLAGARALGIDDITGSLLPGKAADIVALDLSATEPVYHPASALVYTASRSMVTDVWVAGRQVVRNRHLTTLDIPELMTRIRAWGARIAPRELT